MRKIFRLLMKASLMFTFLHWTAVTDLSLQSSSSVDCHKEMAVVKQVCNLTHVR